MLSSHVGVYNTCLRILDGRGYALSVRGEADDDGEPIASELLWIASRGPFEYRADNPVELLGLCAIEWEIQPPPDATSHWWNPPGEDLLKRLLLESFPGSRGRL